MRALLVQVVAWLCAGSPALAIKLGGLSIGKAKAPQRTHFDLVVIGGGSGGLAASKVAAQLGKKVAVANFVKPSPQGTTWGLGGTCVNVGCIPKKLMHHAAQLGEWRRDSSCYGWEMPADDGSAVADEDDPAAALLVPYAKHDWEALVGKVQNHVKSLNFAYKQQCRSNDVEYIDAFATFRDTKTVELSAKDGTKRVITADDFIVATGGRPSYPDIPGAKEHCISSDDLFSLRESPGKTLVVGGGYVALECAGFVHGLRLETTVMMRGAPLRGFDAQMAAHVLEFMEEEGVRFVRGASPTAVELLPSGQKRVHWQPVTPAERTQDPDAEGAAAVTPPAEDCYEDFDTVLLAVGRDAYTHQLGLDTVGVTRHADGKLPVTHERTNVPNIYAIGDIIDGRTLSPPSELTELTPVAIQAGTLLAKRLYGGSSTQMDYQLVPTTVYTPLEYGCIGYSEEAAIAEFGDENVEVYHQYFKPLEWRLTFPRHARSTCYSKLIVHTADSDRVVGLHMCGPHAGEITQGFAVAIKCGATKEDFDMTVGIHPTTAEMLTTMSVTKRSGASPQPTAC